MTRLLSKRLDRVAPSKSMAALSEVARLRAQGREVVSLTIGEPDFATPIHIIDAAIDALRRGETGYRPVNGIPALRKAIRARFSESGLLYSDEELAVGAGAKQIIFAAFAATIDDGDEVIVPVPYWVSYPDIGRLFGAKVVFVPCRPEDGFKLTPSALEAALTARTRWFVLNSPNNPTGAVYTPDELAALGRVLEHRSDCLVLSDEIYQHFIYDEGTFMPFAACNPGLSERVLTVNGVSKTYSMTGFRLGYAGGPGWLITGLNTILTQDTTCASSISQLAAVAALTGDQAMLRANRHEYQARRDQLVTRINAIPGMTCARPGGAFYVFASVQGLIGSRTLAGQMLQTDVDVAAYFLKEAGVATIAGSAFGAENYLRLSFASPIETLDRACDAMMKVVGLLEPRQPQ
jgi:aspartate aminotransferase